ncbi:MAG: hypothetical protein DYG83_06610 [Candidatus Brocadia sp. AMX2]|uniref:Beta-glucosidase-related glycosidases n=1 Tax=Candidatus Brocadia sinica JPN1 TaxID=1197129 RepID=A0ABQ0K238_9BACT|nr:MAG: hypothetical protein EDM70_03905 [Candidatus Brocadia sp. AMX2]MBC6932497.1 hypothetical protein [Candidatus Brocadia sp.]MBL1168882.1 hypothetical protein [Candidatus Brocadia sp. AMX1]GAN34978.1 beta-glucosidase-related glycosidases [Candidatus Brocadia sinica JPN1]MCE7866490.1 hypothetical protein [Candidatus Brocadia sp. AMX2]
MAFYLKMWQWVKINKVEITLFFLCFFSYGYFFHGGGANQNATYDQIRSVVEYGELSINRFAYNTHDISVYKGFVFPNKAPGLTFLSVPIGFVLFQSKNFFLHFMKEDTYFLFVCYFISWLTIGLISAILCVVLYKFIYNLTQHTLAAFIGTMGYAFGTTAFAYSTILYAHQIAAACSFIAFYILFVLKNKKIHYFSSLFFSGLLAGYSVITEYPCFFIWMMLFLYVFFITSEKRKYIIYFLMGSSIPALLLLFYNYLCYGNPIHFSYFSFFIRDAEIHSGLKETVKTISFPRITTLYKISFDSYRGIFFYCPFLFLLFPGIYFFLKKEAVSKEFLISAVITLYFFVFNASYRHWDGGWSLGPRHLVAMIPFTVLLSSFFIKQYPKISICSTLASFFSMLMAVSVTPETPSGRYRNPVMEFYFKNFFDSNLSLNKMPIFTNNFLGDTFNSFNLGNVLHLPDALSLVPFYLMMVIGIMSFSRTAELKVTDVFHSSWSISKINKGAALLKRNARYFKLSLLILLVSILSTQIVIAILGREKATFNKESNYITRPGFLGWYYENKSFDGKPKLVRYDNRISFYDTSFNEIFSGKQYSIIWSGRLYAPRSGLYKFYTESDDGSFLYINDKLVVDNGGDHGIRTKEGTMYLTEGYYDIKVKYYNSMGKGHIKVFWEIPDGLRCLLGEDNVYNYIMNCAILNNTNK